jgi:hypothetical protein
MNTMPQGPFCQSCSMPMTKPEDVGTSADGSPSDLYCTFCYQGGKFTRPDITMDGMIAQVTDIMIGMGMPNDLIEKTKGFIPTLARWRKG